MSKDTLDNLFTSRVRVKVLKSLFRNFPADFTISELARRIQESPNAIRKEIKSLIKINLVKRNKNA